MSNYKKSKLNIQHTIGCFLSGNTLHYRVTLGLDFKVAKHSFMKPSFSCLPVVQQFIFFETVFLSAAVATQCIYLLMSVKFSGTRTLGGCQNLEMKSSNVNNNFLLG